MCVRYLGFVLLAWLPGFLHAQIACGPPELTNGYFVSRQEKYNSEPMLTYSCETGFKPVVEGWWATSTCLNGKWTPTPECVDSSACLPLAIENGKYEEAQKASYENHDTAKVICDDGFDISSNIIHCTNGKWSPKPECERNDDACDKPDEIPHAVIINQEPKEVYRDRTDLEYQCEKGYTTGQANHRGTITCQGGTWTKAQSCILTCELDLSRLNIGETSQITMKEGETKQFGCSQHPEYFILTRCSNRKIEVSQCCHRRTIDQNQCSVSTTL